jgi:hypothetical protein
MTAFSQHTLTEVTAAQGQAWSKALVAPAGGYPVLVWHEQGAWRVWPALTDGALVYSHKRPVAWRAASRSEPRGSRLCAD